MLKAALEFAQAQSPEEKLSPEKKLKIAQRLMLYERGTTKNAKFPYNFISGIQSRIFYAEIRKGEIVEKEVWEWVAAPSRDFFIPRDETSMPRNVIAQQFFPVTQFWYVNQRLPQTNKEIELTINTYNRKLEANLPTWIWKVYMTPKQALDALV